MAYDMNYCFQVMMHCINDPVFIETLRRFEREHCREFEDQEENKLYYTTIHNQYMQLIEMWIEGRMAQVIPGFSMDTFLPELNDFIQSGAAERGDAKKVIELLNSWADFLSFKEMMLNSSKVIFAAIE
ncbi:unnamed protein product [Cladocopium goreaui]|uniref:ADP-ribosylation factor-like protein 2-binding protein n=1 Tax=Cladocopium goreaui TaxID=2562237 RepID=A0A9P1GDL7_9DINO|nr:unnamed protein product [Cladocopium goreaui]